MHKVLLAAILALAGGASAAAHPHVFVETGFEFLREAGKVSAVRVTWRFDPLYSGMVRDSFDGNRDGKIDGKELDKLRAEVFDKLGDMNWFTVLYRDGREIKPKRAGDFAAQIDKQGASYSFSVPLDDPAAPGTVLQVLSFDPEFFIDFRPRRPGSDALETLAAAHACPAKPVTLQTLMLGPITIEAPACTVAPE